MKNKIFISTFISVVFCLQSFAQSSIINPSLFYYNLSKFNSAFTGGGNFRANLFTRHQWVATDNYPEIYGASTDIPLRKIKGFKGIGLSILKTKAGEGKFETQNISQTSAFEVKLKDNFWASMGMRISYIKNSVDWSKLVFSSQIDPVNGVIYPQPAIIELYKNDINSIDFSAGFTLKYEYKSKRKVNITTVAGVNFEHIIQTQYLSLIGDEFRIPMALTCHIGSIISLNKSRSIRGFAPAFVYEYQNKTGTFLFGSNVIFLNSYHLPIRKQNAISLTMGLWSRISNGDNQSHFTSVILSTGLLNIGGFLDIAYSYDITTIDKFKPGNTHELVLSFDISNTNPHGIVPCPKFNSYGY